MTGKSTTSGERAKESDRTNYLERAKYHERTIHSERPMKTHYLPNNTTISSKGDPNAYLQSLAPGSIVERLNGWTIWKPKKPGDRLSGKRQKGKGDQQEGQEPLFRCHLPKFELQGWEIVDNKDGIAWHVPHWRMVGVDFLNSGEDCVTAYAGNGLVKYCYFTGDENSDKCLQLLVADGTEVVNSNFEGFITAIQCGLTKRGNRIYARPEHETIVHDTAFQSCSTPIVAVIGKVREYDNVYNQSGKNRTDAGGRITKK